MAGGKSDCRCMEITIPHILLCTKPPAADCRGLFYEILSLSFILGFLHHIIQRGYPCAGSAFGLKGKGRRITPGRACDIQVYPWFSFAEFPDKQSRRNGTAAVGAHIFHICHITLSSSGVPVQMGNEDIFQRNGQALFRTVHKNGRHRT